MHILITGANGYIGQRLAAVLAEQGHQITCCVRSKKRFTTDHIPGPVQVVEVDFSGDVSQVSFPEDIDVAFFLIHSMREGASFEASELRAVTNFLQLVSATRCQQIIYLSGIVNAPQLSRHLSSRLAVEQALRAGKVPVTVLRAGIVVGSGSSSFEIIRDLVEKLPVMITPEWVNTRCQPIAIRNVISFLAGTLLMKEAYNQDFDIGGPEVLTYKQMLLQFAAVRGLKRYIITVPVMTPRLSSYWLYFVTSTSYQLAVNLVDSMKVDVICRPNNLSRQLNITLLTYKEAVALAFQKIEQQEVISSWKDAFSASNADPRIIGNIEVPVFGCFKDIKRRTIDGNEQEVLQKIWSIGGETGWYYGNTLWKLRGLMDKAFGGVGLRRGRTHRTSISGGDALDFWRVIVADKANKRLLLFAEMKLPGEAWLEFQINQKEEQSELVQTATFRPKGILGRLYWYSMLPFHYFIFNGMINALLKTDKK
ncbi:SDR family oxidoreductase [Chitinophaga sp. Cy-1792]|uniref:SDR family oxidoreductase n=1 Tax=Chitinophaga sp. Cy-1792 TaxID=2608339 RepID=UPI0014211006|nr:SDR family oxidoreductase [Chitinophaga sp. Cy-1792]NIG54530.1 SDR family oxidoreductase [Chitinophaga sp. Cy-1792]